MPTSFTYVIDFLVVVDTLIVCMLFVCVNVLIAIRFLVILHITQIALQFVSLLVTVNIELE